MIRHLFCKLAKGKNPDFILSKSVSNQVLMSYLAEMSLSLFRGIIFRFSRLQTPKKLFIGKGVSIRNSQNIHFGHNVIIEQGAILSALPKNGMIIGNSSRIGAYSSIHVSKNFKDVTGHIIIGNNVGIGEFAHLGGAGGLTIGDYCIIGSYLSCHPENHNFQDKEELIMNQGVNRKGITIGRNCWIGAKVTILDGSKVGDGSVIAAGSIVRGFYPDNSVIAGIPAKVIKMR